MPPPGEIESEIESIEDMDQPLEITFVRSLFETLAECAQSVSVRVRECGVEETDHRHRRLLRARRERLHGRRAADKRDELAPSHIDCPRLVVTASLPSSRRPSSVIPIRATSIILPSTTLRSACADASPVRTNSSSNSIVNPFATMRPSVQPSGLDASNSSARLRSGVGTRLRLR
jgi:hypothetical protein